MATYVYYGSDGAIKEIFSDTVRNFSSYQVYCYFGDEEIDTISGTVTNSESSSSTVATVSEEISVIPYDKYRTPQYFKYNTQYMFRVFDIDNDYVRGEYIRLTPIVNNVPVAMVQLPVESNNIAIDQSLNYSTYSYLLDIVNKSMGLSSEAIATANTASGNASAAVLTANSAKATAEGIDAKATEALANATTALNTANGIDAKATEALSTAKYANEISYNAEAISKNAETIATSKQDKLTFDTTPTAGSTNPVTSGGIKTYVDNAVTITRVTGSVIYDASTAKDDLYNIMIEHPFARFYYSIRSSSTTFERNQLTIETVMSSSIDGEKSCTVYSGNGTVITSGMLYYEYFE